MKLVLMGNLESERYNQHMSIELSQIEWAHFAAQDQSVPFQKNLNPNGPLSTSMP